MILLPCMLLTRDTGVHSFPVPLNISDEDEILACMACAPGDEPCRVCGQIPYRMICIRRQRKAQEDVFLCGKHYLEMLNSRPDLSGLEKSWRK
jgi:hypothetical protein